MDNEEPKQRYPRDLVGLLGFVIIALIAMLSALVVPLLATVSRSCHKEPLNTAPAQNIEQPE